MTNSTYNNICMFYVKNIIFPAVQENVDNVDCTYFNYHVITSATTYPATSQMTQFSTIIIKFILTVIKPFVSV